MAPLPYCGRRSRRLCMAESYYFPPKGGAAKAEKDWKLGRGFCYNHHRHVLVYSIRFQPQVLPGRRGGQSHFCGEPRKSGQSPENVRFQPQALPCSQKENPHAPRKRPKRAEQRAILRATPSFLRLRLLPKRPGNTKMEIRKPADQLPNNAENGVASPAANVCDETVPVSPTARRRRKTVPFSC